MKSGPLRHLTSYILGGVQYYKRMSIRMKFLQQRRHGSENMKIKTFQE